MPFLNNFWRTSTSACVARRVCSHPIWLSDDVTFTSKIGRDSEANEQLDRCWRSGDMVVMKWKWTEALNYWPNSRKHVSHKGVHVCWFPIQGAEMFASKPHPMRFFPHNADWGMLREVNQGFLLKTKGYRNKCSHVWQKSSSIQVAVMFAQEKLRLDSCNCKKSIYMEITLLIKRWIVLTSTDELFLWS